MYRGEVGKGTLEKVSMSVMGVIQNFGDCKGQLLIEKFEE